MKTFRKRTGIAGMALVLTVSFFIFPCGEGTAFNFPAAGRRHGDASIARENSKAAISKAPEFDNPYIELDIIDFADADGHRIDPVSHDCLMKRATELPGAFSEKYDSYSKIPLNAANPNLPPGIPGRTRPGPVADC